MKPIIEDLYRLKLEDYKRNTEWFVNYLVDQGYSNAETLDIINEFYAWYYGPVYLFMGTH